MTQTRFTVTIPENLANARLDRALAELCDDLSRSRIKGLIEEGAVRLRETPITSASTKVHEGQTFAIVIPEPRPTAIEGQKIDLEVLFEDEEIIVINKPAGLVVHPGAGNPDGTLVNALIAHCGDSLKGIGGEQRPGIVHRLDKDTSGVMVAAKTSTAHAELVRQFSQRLTERVLPKAKSKAISGEAAGTGPK
jgi:23S rRNA pseudouridine1911/1915/1917 synthase